jgi:hypothetical protein
VVAKLMAVRMAGIMQWHVAVARHREYGIRQRYSPAPVRVA